MNRTPSFSRTTNARGLSAVNVRETLVALRQAMGTRGAATLLHVGAATLVQACTMHQPIGNTLLLALYGVSGTVLRPEVRAALADAGRQAAQPAASEPQPAPATLPPPMASAVDSGFAGLTIADLLARARAELVTIENDLDERTGEILSLEAMAARYAAHGKDAK